MLQVAQGEERLLPGGSLRRSGFINCASTAASSEQFVFGCCDMDLMHLSVSLELQHVCLLLHTESQGVDSSPQTAAQALKLELVLTPMTPS